MLRSRAQRRGRVSGLMWERTTLTTGGRAVAGVSGRHRKATRPRLLFAFDWCRIAGAPCCCSRVAAAVKGVFPAGKTDGRRSAVAGARALPDSGMVPVYVRLSWTGTLFPEHLGQWFTKDGQ